MKLLMFIYIFCLSSSLRNHIYALQQAFLLDLRVDLKVQYLQTNLSTKNTLHAISHICHKQNNNPDQKYEIMSIVALRLHAQYYNTTYNQSKLQIDKVYNNNQALLQTEILMPDKIYKVGIRRQNKSVWERRAPLSPCHVKDILESEKDIQIIVQPCKKRVFSDYEYEEKGAIIQQSLQQCDLIIGIKQIPVQMFIPQKTYMYFSHTIKAQPHNMPALDRINQLKIRLIDYEKITDDNNSRLIAFGKYAGIAGAIDFLKGFGEYIMQMGISTPFLNANCSYKYFDIGEAYEHLKLIGTKITQKTIPEELRPMIFAITGRGRTAKGCLQVLQNLPITLIQPSDVQSLCQDKTNPTHAKTIYVVNINSQDVMTPRDDTLKFDKQDYYKNPGKYKNVFHQRYLPYITALFHCIYWDTSCPKYIKNKHLKELASQKRLRLLGICDVSCDLQGSIECLKQYTQPEKPFFYFDSIKQEDTFNNHYEYGKFVYLAIDFLPSQLAYDASMEFSRLLKHWIPGIVRSDQKVDIEDQDLISQLKRAVISTNGRLTPKFEYITKLREQHSSLMNTMIKKEQIIKTQVGETASILSHNVSIIPAEKIKPQVLSFDDEQQQEQPKQQTQKKQN